MRKLLFILVLLAAAMAVHAQDDDLTPQTWTFDQRERTYYLHAPETLTEPAPLLIALHERFGDGTRMARLTHFNELADREGFIVAYPDGIGGEWNFVRGVRGYDMPQDDTAFLVALINHVAEDYPVDRSRVYLAGFSNGGFMAQRAACENPAPFAAFASVAAAGFGGMPDVCPLTSAIPVPILLINGTADTNVPWEGTGVTRGGQTIYVTYPVSVTLSYWAQLNNCTPDAETTDIPASGETQVRILSLSCPHDTAVLLYAIIGGGHNWAGQPEGDPLALGSINRDIDASEEIWKFFSQRRRATEAATESAPP